MDLMISLKCGSWVHISHELKKCMLRVYYSSDSVLEMTDPNIIRQRPCYQRGSCLKVEPEKQMNGL